MGPIFRFGKVPGTMAVAVSLCMSGAATLSATEYDTRLNQFKAQVDSLRCRGELEAALRVVGDLSSFLDGEPDARVHDREDVIRLEGSLEHISSLPESARRELAEADCLTPQIIADLYAGRFEGKRNVIRQLEIRERHLGAESLEVTASVTNLGVFLRYQGEYVGADALYRRAIAQYRHLLGNTHPDVAMGLNNLGQLLKIRGDYTGAEPLYQESLAMNQEIYTGDHIRVASSLNNLGALYLATGELEKAEPLFLESLAMRTRLLGEEDSRVATARNNLAYLLLVKGDYDRAEATFRQALSTMGYPEVNEGSTVATTINNLGELLWHRGDADDAEPLLRESLEMFRRCLGEEHPRVAQSLIDLALLHIAEGFLQDAETELTEACRVHDAARSRVPIGSNRSGFQLSPYPYLAAVSLTREKEENAWPACEHTHCRSLWDLLSRTKQRSVSAAEQAREDSMRTEIGQLEDEVRVFLENVPLADDEDARRRAEESRDRLLVAKARWSAFQEKIGTRYPVTEGRGFDLSRVQASLSAEQGIIGWLDVTWGTRDESEKQGWGYLIRNHGPVVWKKLDIRTPGTVGAGAAVSRAERYIEEVTSSSSRMWGTEATEAGKDLFDERLAPLWPHLNGVRELIVIPSGDMFGAPIEALPTGNGHLVGGTLLVSYSPSATIRTWLEETRPENEGNDRFSLLLVGDPPFSEDQLRSMSLSSTRAATTVASNERGRGRRNSAGRGDRDSQTALARLPWSREEIERISSSSPGATTRLLGADASEQEFVRLAQSGELSTFDVVHIATHAVPDDERAEKSSLILSQVGLPDPVKAAIEGRRIYDGRLTVEEIVREWKLNAELVTLSGCDTALGTKIAGEGYVGFAHAFLQVGARSVLVSLWPVEDRSTSLLMQRFYENLLGTRGITAMPKAEALQEAKAHLRGYEEDGAHPYSHPYYWGPFTLIGDPN